MTCEKPERCAFLASGRRAEIILRGAIEAGDANSDDHFCFLVTLYYAAYYTFWEDGKIFRPELTHPSYATATLLTFQ